MIKVHVLGILIAAFSFIASSLLDTKAAEEETEVRVMSYNIRYDNPDDGINRWDNRKERVLNLIRFHKADIFGLQEAEYHQLAWLAERLPEYKWEGVGRADGAREGEFSPVFYDRGRFMKRSGGTFWLSPTPEKPSTGWDAALPRIVSWVQLEERSSGKILYFFNTHFDHVGTEARKKSAGLILDQISGIVGDAPVVLSGDFNVTPGSEPYSVLSGILQDGFSSSRYSHYGPEATFLDGGGPFNVADGQGGRRIDYIFANSGVAFIRHGIISTFREGRFPSDHLPVIADVRY